MGGSCRRGDSVVYGQTFMVLTPDFLGRLSIRSLGTCSSYIPSYGCCLSRCTQDTGRPRFEWDL